MNIFASNDSPLRSAKFLDDKRVVKMILESAQMLCTAAATHKVEVAYEPAFTDHPCTQWTMLNVGNYGWLLRHFQALLQEYTYRYHRQHKCETLLPSLVGARNAIPAGKRTEFANCSGKYLRALIKPGVQLSPEDQHIYQALQQAMGVASLQDLPITQRYIACLLLKWYHDIRRPTWHGHRVPLLYQHFCHNLMASN